MIAPHRANRRKPPTQDRRRLRRHMRRWLVERFFAWIQWQRRILIRWKYHTQNSWALFKSPVSLSSSHDLRMGWTGRAPALSGRASKHEEHAAMSQKTNAVAVRTIGIDTGKNTLHLIGLDEQGTIVLREKLARGRIGRRLTNASPFLIGIEAGMATHYVARELLALGHDVRQVPPAYAKPFRQGHKNDFRDAYAIAEAVLRPSTRWKRSRRRIRDLENLSAS
jgi:hypothetical protein